MASKHATGSHSTVIRCPNCGEDYSITYKRCPFCDEKATAARRKEADDFDDGYDEEGGSAARGGKRLAGGSHRGGRGGGGGEWTPMRVVGTVVSLAVIVAAVWIVVTQVMPLVNRGEVTEPTPPPSVQVTPSPAPSPSDSLPVSSDAQPSATDGLSQVTPAPSPLIPSTQTASNFTLNKSDVTINDKYPDPIRLKVTFSPAGTTGEITWSSSNSEVVSVDGSGLVSAGSKTGTATITATMAGGFQQTCTVRNSVTGGSAPAAQPSDSGGSSAALSLNHTDFSFSGPNDVAVQMKVNGTSSTPAWSIGDTSVATISEGGLVKPVGSGTTTISCTVDGQTLKCIVRCQF